MHVFAASQNLGEASLDIFVEIAALGRPVYERGQGSTLLLAAFLLPSTSFFCFEDVSKSGVMPMTALRWSGGERPNADIFRQGRTFLLLLLFLSGYEPFTELLLLLVEAGGAIRRDVSKRWCSR